MKQLQNINCDYKKLSPLTLAFIGDGVYELFVRENLILNGKNSVNKMNKDKIEKVCCKAQSKAAKRILNYLNDEELIIFKRGRNAHTHCIPKNATSEEYHNSTGLEALIGYIYLKGDIKRLQEIFDLISNFD